MGSYVAFLRAINIGKRQYPMAALRTALTEAGFADVDTHIQTGNVRFTTTMRSCERITARLEETMAADRGFEVRAIVFRAAELAEVAARAEELNREFAPQGHYLALLRDAPRAGAADVVAAMSGPGETVRLAGRAVHLMLADRTFHEARVGNATIEKSLGVATTRNISVIRKLSEKWDLG